MYSLCRVNENDRFYHKAIKLLKEITSKKAEIVVSQYILLEFINLCKVRFAEDYFDENPEVHSLPAEENIKVNKKIRDALDALDVFFGIKVVYITLLDEILKPLIDQYYNIFPSYKKNYYKVKMVGVLDIIHLLSCTIIDCDYFVTFDKDFNSEFLRNLFEDFAILVN